MKDILKKSWDDLLKVSFWTECVCELMVSFILMTVVVFVMVSNKKELYEPSTTHFGIFVAAFVFMAIEGYGPIACLLNPMATFSMFLAGKISLSRCLLFTIVELVGALGGTYFGYLLTPHNREIPYFDPSHHGMSNWQSVLMEGFFSFNLIFVVLSVHGNELPRSLPGLPNLSIAFALAVGLFSAGTHTGGFMNPLIPLGPAVLKWNFTNHWVFWVGPYLGGPLAVGAYKLMVKGKLYKSQSELINESIVRSNDEAKV